ncbi:MAG: C10 family peptidase [Bacteroidaceae bacterium]|nr:C10 family peptidase [Bacteroidaceae bacterium]
MKRLCTILRIALIMLSVVFDVNVYAQQIDKLEATDIANDFFKSNQGRLKFAAAESEQLDLVYTEPSAEDSNAANLYVFNRKDGGFAIIAGDARANDLVLGYSFDNDFSAENMPSNVKYWLGEYARQIDFMKAHQSEVSTSIRSKKRTLIRKASSVDTDGTWLLKTEWGQSYSSAKNVYNNYAPKKNGELCLTGCVATAMAQVLYYHAETDSTKFQPDFIGTTSYTWNNTTLSAPYDNDAEFQWDKMKLTTNDLINDEEANKAVAKLMRDCGVAVEMNYGPDGSGAFSIDVVKALQRHFGYSLMMKTVCRDNYKTQTEWDNLMIAEIDAKRPVLYSAQDDHKKGGHAFVMDGYKYDSENNVKYHINWGWRGSYNGFYVSSALNASEYDFNTSQQAIVNLYPNEDDDWSEWTNLGKLEYTYTAANSYLNKDKTVAPVTVYSQTAHDGDYIVYKITDWGNGVYDNFKDIEDVYITIDRTQKINNSDSKYLAYIQVFNSGQLYEYQKQKYEMFFRDKLSGGITESKSQYSYYDAESKTLFLNLYMSFGGYYMTASNQDKLNLDWTIWEEFAPKGSCSGVYKYNTNGEKTTVNKIYLRTNVDNPERKQIKVQDWLKNIIDSNTGTDLIFDWDTISNECIFEKTDTRLQSSSKSIYFENKQQEKSSYNPETGIFSIHGGFYCGDNLFEGTNVATDTLQMSGYSMSNEYQFYVYRADRQSYADSLPHDDDSEAVFDLVSMAKSAIGALEYIESINLDKNKERVDSIITKLEKDIENKRAEELNIAKTAFDNYKKEKQSYADSLFKNDDSDAVINLISKAKSDIDKLNYIESNSLEDNKARVDSIITRLEKDIKTQRVSDQLLADRTAFETYKAEQLSYVDSLFKIGDSETVMELISNAKKEIETLSYNEQKTLDKNKTAVDVIVSILENKILTQREADFKSFKTNRQLYVDSLSKDGDSEAVLNIIDSTKSVLESLKYEKTMTLNENKQVVDSIIAKLENDIEIQRAADLQTAKSSFESYKSEMRSYSDSLALDGDSEAVMELIIGAKSAIDSLEYDESMTLSENEQVVDSIIAKLENDIQIQRAADLRTAKLSFESYKSEMLSYSDSLTRDGDSEAVIELINGAKSAIESLEYDESKSLEYNDSVVDSIIIHLEEDIELQRAADRLAAAKSSFESYKSEMLSYSDSLTQDGDSEAVIELINGAKSAIESLEYDESKSLEYNDSVVDSIIIHLEEDIELQRAADRLAAAKLSFELYKTEMQSYADSLAMSDDSAEIFAFIISAKDRINEFVYNEGLSLADNMSMIDAEINQLKSDLEKIRIAAAIYQINNSSDNLKIYTLDGKRIEVLSKSGIYIINGVKKFVNIK